VLRVMVEAADAVQAVALARRISACVPSHAG